MFWGTVIEPGARIVISAPPNVSQIHITKAVPYQAHSFARHRLFVQIKEAPPIVVCNDDVGCSLDVKLSKKDIDSGPVFYQTEGECNWALSGEATEETISNGQKTTDSMSFLEYTCSIVLLITMMNTLILVAKKPVL